MRWGQVSKSLRNQHCSAVRNGRKASPANRGPCERGWTHLAFGGPRAAAVDPELTSRGCSCPLAPLGSCVHVHICQETPTVRGDEGQSQSPANKRHIGLSTFFGTWSIRICGALMCAHTPVYCDLNIFADSCRGVRCQVIGCGWTARKASSRLRLPCWKNEWAMAAQM